jgi:hypothetical protein
MTFRMAQSLTSEALDPQGQLSESPTIRSAGCSWMGGDTTVGLTIWEKPPAVNNYAMQSTEAKYIATAKRCPGAYYRVVSALGNRAFASYCTTNTYNSNNEQTVTWQYGDLLLSVGIGASSSAQDRIPALIAVARAISSKL